MTKRLTAKSAPPPVEVEPPPEDRFLKLTEVIQIAGIGKTMIYRLIRLGTFPQPYRPGGASSRWDAAEVRAWRAKIMADREG
jgi:prophage regulatory protein